MTVSCFSRLHVYIIIFEPVIIIYTFTITEKIKRFSPLSYYLVVFCIDQCFVCNVY